jgi:predicted RNA-binding protein
LTPQPQKIRMPLSDFIRRNMSSNNFGLSKPSYDLAMPKEKKNLAIPLRSALEYRTPTMKYTKNNRKQLLSYVGARSLVIMIKELEDNAPVEVIKQINKCSDHLEVLQNFLHKGEKLVLETKAYYRYLESITKMQQAVDEVLGYETRLKLDYISGVIGVCCDMEEEISRHNYPKEYKNAWAGVVETLQNIYEHYDPDFEHDEINENGKEIAQRIRDIIWLS